MLLLQTGRSRVEAAEIPIIEEVETGADTLLNELWENLDQQEEQDEKEIPPIEKSTPIEFIPGTDIPKDKKEIEVEPDLNEEDDEGINIEDERSLAAKSPNTLGAKQISLLMKILRGIQMIFKFNQMN